MFQVVSMYSHFGELTRDFDVSYNLHDSASTCQTFWADFVSANDLILELGLTGRFVAAYLTSNFHCVFSYLFV
jgi:hypothetical protein